jgi:hypothetical protein
MNKIITVALIAGGLLLLDSPEAAAHKEVRNAYQSSANFRFVAQRAKLMPRWLKRNKSFRKWYQHTRLRRNRHLAWNRLFEIYRWERVHLRQHRRDDHRYRDYYGSNDYYRDFDRKNRRGNRYQ